MSFRRAVEDLCEARENLAGMIEGVLHPRWMSAQEATLWAGRLARAYEQNLRDGGGDHHVHVYDSLVSYLEKKHKGKEPHPFLRQNWGYRGGKSLQWWDVLADDIFAAIEDSDYSKVTTDRTLEQY